MHMQLLTVDCFYHTVHVQLLTTDYFLSTTFLNDAEKDIMI